MRLYIFNKEIYIYKMGNGHHRNINNERLLDLTNHVISDIDYNNNILILNRNYGSLIHITFKNDKFNKSIYIFPYDETIIIIGNDLLDSKVTFSQNHHFLIKYRELLTEIVNNIYIF
jgi:hypothetical protein